MLKFISLLSILFLFSCKGNTDYIRYVDNQSGETVRVISAFPGEDDFRLTMIPNQETRLFTSTEKNGSDQTIDPSNGIEYFIVLNEKGDTCKKDFKQVGNWRSEVKLQSKYLKEYEQDYTITIYKTDF
jgi:hypothetical protein